MILLSMKYQLLSDEPNFQPPTRVPFLKLSDVENFAHDGLTKGIIRATMVQPTRNGAEKGRHNAILCGFSYIE